MSPPPALTIPVGEKLDQAIEAGVPHLPDVGSTAPDGLDGGRHKVLVHAADVGLGRRGRDVQYVTHMPVVITHWGSLEAPNAFGMASAHSSW